MCVCFQLPASVWAPPRPLWIFNRWVDEFSACLSKSLLDKGQELWFPSRDKAVTACLMNGSLSEQHQIIKTTAGICIVHHTVQVPWNPNSVSPRTWIGKRTSILIFTNHNCKVSFPFITNQSGVRNIREIVSNRKHRYFHILFQVLWLIKSSYHCINVGY